MSPFTAVCMEATPGYPDPLIYHIYVADDVKYEDVFKVVLKQRVSELGEEFEEELRTALRVCFLLPGHHQPDFIKHDWRT